MGHASRNLIFGLCILIFVLLVIIYVFNNSVEKYKVMKIRINDKIAAIEETKILLDNNSKEYILLTEQEDFLKKLI